MATHNSHLKDLRMILKLQRDRNIFPPNLILGMSYNQPYNSVDKLLLNPGSHLKTQPYGKYL